MKSCVHSAQKSLQQPSLVHWIHCRRTRLKEASFEFLVFLQLLQLFRLNALYLPIVVFAKPTWKLFFIEICNQSRMKVRAATTYVDFPLQPKMKMLMEACRNMSIFWRTFISSNYSVSLDKLKTFLTTYSTREREDEGKQKWNDWRRKKFILMHFEFQIESLPSNSKIPSDEFPNTKKRESFFLGFSLLTLPHSRLPPSVTHDCVASFLHAGLSYSNIFFTRDLLSYKRLRKVGSRRKKKYISV